MVYVYHCVYIDLHIYVYASYYAEKQIHIHAYTHIHPTVHTLLYYTRNTYIIVYTTLHYTLHYTTHTCLVALIQGQYLINPVNMIDIVSGSFSINCDIQYDNWP